MFLLRASKNGEQWVSLWRSLSVIMIQQSCSLYITTSLLVSLQNKGNLWSREICCHLCLTAACAAQCALNRIQQQTRQKIRTRSTFGWMWWMCEWLGCSILILLFAFHFIRSMFSWWWLTFFDVPGMLGALQPFYSTAHVSNALSGILYWLNVCSIVDYRIRRCRCP